MSDGIAKPETEGEKRAQLLRKLATWEDNVSRGVEQLETYRRMVLNQEEDVASDTKRRDELRAEVAALFALTPEGKEALLESQPEPIPTEVRKQDEQDAVGEIISGEPWEMSEEDTALSEAIAPAQEAPAIPEGFTEWDPTTNCRFISDTIVKCWMGGDDYMGPLRAGDVDWDHKSDPVLAVKVIRYFDGTTPEERAEASAEAERIEDARDGTPSTEQTEHDRPKLTNEEWDKLEKVAAVDGVDQTEVVDQTNALISEENDAPTGSGAPVSSTNIAADESVPVLDATDIAEVLQKNVPGDALLATYADGKLYATFGGSTYLVIDAPEKADGFKETPERDAYAPIHNEDEPSDAAVFAHGLNVEIDQKADNTNPFNPFRLFGGAKKTLVGEGV